MASCNRGLSIALVKLNRSKTLSLKRHPFCTILTKLETKNNFQICLTASLNDPTNRELVTVSDYAGTFDLLQTSEEWHIVFYISAGIYILGCVFYAVTASGKRQTWAQTTAEDANPKPASSLALQNVHESQLTGAAQQNAHQ